MELVNWNVILNIVLLIGVVFVLMRTLRKKRDTILPLDERNKPYIKADSPTADDIISVRKVETIEEKKNCLDKPMLNKQDTLMFFLLAKKNQQLVGYEMLQAILAAGLRFGEGQIFHRYQYTQQNQGPVIFSLAAATAQGTFDLQNIGAFRTKGLCLFMYLSGQPVLDVERFDNMVDVAQQLSEELDTYLLDEKRQVFTDEKKLGIYQFIESKSGIPEKV